MIILGAKNGPAGWNGLVQAISVVPPRPAAAAAAESVGALLLWPQKCLGVCGGWARQGEEKEEEEEEEEEEGRAEGRAGHPEVSLRQ